MASELESWQEIKEAALAGLKKLMTSQEYSAGAGLSVRRAQMRDFKETIALADQKIQELSGTAGSGFDPGNRAEFVNSR